MKGRKPTPTKLKLLRGNPGKRAINRNEPQAPAGRPAVVEGLTAFERRVWEAVCADLEAIGVLNTAHRFGVFLTAESIAELIRCRRVIKKEGATYESAGEDGKTMIRARPEVAMKNEARRFAKAMLVEFGLTPASATRIQVGTEEKEDDTEAFLFGDAG